MTMTGANILNLLNSFPSKRLKDSDVTEWIGNAKYTIIRNGSVYLVNYDTYQLLNGKCDWVIVNGDKFEGKSYLLTFAEKDLKLFVSEKKFKYMPELIKKFYSIFNK